MTLENVVGSSDLLNKLAFALQDLVRRALDVEPSRRPTAAQVLSHPWMTAKDLADTKLSHDNPSLMKVSV